MQAKNSEKKVPYGELFYIYEIDKNRDQAFFSFGAFTKNILAKRITDTTTLSTHQMSRPNLITDIGL